MDTTELANRWQRDGYDVPTRQVMPDISRSPHAHPFDTRGLILAGELTLTWEGQTHTPFGLARSSTYRPVAYIASNTARK